MHFIYFVHSFARTCLVHCDLHPVCLVMLKLLKEVKWNSCEIPDCVKQHSYVEEQQDMLPVVDTGYVTSFVYSNNECVSMCVRCVYGHICPMCSICFCFNGYLFVYEETEILPLWATYTFTRQSIQVNWVTRNQAFANRCSHADM